MNKNSSLQVTERVNTVQFTYTIDKAIQSGLKINEFDSLITGLLDLSLLCSVVWLIRLTTFLCSGIW